MFARLAGRRASALAYALRISLTHPARNHPRKTTTAETKQTSAANIVQSAAVVTPRNAETSS
ncbi:MAG: hypothetical protein WBZ22_25855, partial [Pseudolabrys sp.]